MFNTKFGRKKANQIWIQCTKHISQKDRKGTFRHSHFTLNHFLYTHEPHGHSIKKSHCGARSCLLTPPLPSPQKEKILHMAWGLL